MIRTARLDLVPVSVDLLNAELESAAALGALLGTAIPATWPPDLYDESAVRWTLNRLMEPPRGPDGFWSYYFVLRDDGGARVLVGVGGFKGPPGNGRVELGYSIVESYRRRGLASEAVHGMLEYAFANGDVSEVTAQTLPELIASIGVLEKTGFRFVGPGDEDGVVLYAQARQ